MSEAKRLAPLPGTLRELFLKSGNLCAFPGCSRLMMNSEGVFIGNVCHIEAAEEGGERFNSAMTNEERRAFSNLMLMCYEHHQVTNDVAKYSVAALQKMKAEHERRFSDPERVILESLVDHTTQRSVHSVSNLKRLDAVLGLLSDLDEDQKKITIDELNDFIKKLELIPSEVLRFAGALAERVLRTSRFNRSSDEVQLPISDVMLAFGLSERVIKERIQQLDHYSLGDYTEIGDGMGSVHGIRLYNLRSGWPVWSDLAAFCKAAPERMDTFTVDLNFGCLDE